MFVPSKDFDKNCQVFKQEFEKFSQPDGNVNITTLDLNEQNKNYEKEFQKLLLKENMEKQSDNIFQEVLSKIILEEEEAMFSILMKKEELTQGRKTKNF